MLSWVHCFLVLQKLINVSSLLFCVVLIVYYVFFFTIPRNYHYYLKAPAGKRSDVYKNHSPLIARPLSSNFPKHIEVAGQNPDRVIEGWFSHVGTK